MPSDFPENRQMPFKDFNGAAGLQRSMLNLQPPHIPDHELLKRIGGGSYCAGLYGAASMVGFREVMLGKTASRQSARLTLCTVSRITTSNLGHSGSANCCIACMTRL